MTEAPRDHRDPSRVEVVVACWDDPALPALVARAGRRARVVVLLTDEADRAQSRLLPSARVTLVEPEDLLAGGIAPHEARWDAAVGPWMRAIFPGALDGVALGDLLWVNVFLQPAIQYRLQELVLATELVRRYGPTDIHLAARVPPLCDGIARAARSLGVRMHRPLADTLRAGAERALRWPVGLGAAAGLVASAALRHGMRVRARARLGAKLSSVRALAGALGGAVEPRVWIAASGKWRQVSRHLLETVLDGAPSQGDQPRAVGLAFAAPYGEGRESPAGLVDEAALFDGRLARHRPAALDQLAGADDLAGGLAVLARGLPLAARAALAVIRHAPHLTVDGAAASSAADVLPLLRNATHGVLRVVDARHAARRFVRRHPSARVVVFGFAPGAESKVADLALQRAGVVTVDYLHAYIGEPCLRTEFRSASRVLASWTREEAARFAAAGTNARCVGGYVPRVTHARPVVLDGGARRRVLVATNYLHLGNAETLRRHRKHARRLAAALAHLAASRPAAVEIVLRPHPEEDRELWRELLDAARAPSVTLSDAADLARDLAAADVVIATNSSVVIEALRYPAPLLVHVGPHVEPGVLVGQVDRVRRFADGAELVRAVDLALAARDLAPERRLLELAFGPTRAPTSIWTLLDELAADSDAAASATG